MSGFFNSLTARSFGTGSSIRPRVALLFEPRKNASPRGPEGLEDTEEAAATREPERELQKDEVTTASMKPERDGSAQNQESATQVRLMSASRTSDPDIREHLEVSAKDRAGRDLFPS